MPPSTIRFLSRLVFILVLMLPFPALANQKPTVIDVPDTFKTCTQDSDCVVMDKGCAFCCTADVINIHRREDYAKLTEGKCALEKPSVCSCERPAYVPVCAKGKCELEIKN